MKQGSCWTTVLRNWEYNCEEIMFPYICGVFCKAGLVRELVSDVARGRKRDLIKDVMRLSGEFDKVAMVNVEGVENISKNSGSLVVFNHPNIDTLFPALAKLIVEISAEERKNPVIVMSSEIPLFGRINKYPIPGSLAFIRRFHSMYPENIISAPTAQVRRDYLRGRAIAALHVVRALKDGNVVLISPEGHVERSNIISPSRTLNLGSGELAIISTRLNIPINPVGIWVEGGAIHVKVGEQFKINTNNGEDAVNGLMRHVAALLPNELRGPFREKERRMHCLTVVSG